MIKHVCSVFLTVLWAASAHAQLRITEVESSEAAGLHQDWWELTNFGTEAVSLAGYKFDDGSALIANSVGLTSSLTIKPGESIVFVEALTAEAFRAWWGSGLSPDAQIVTYSGSGLGLSSTGDGVNVWDANGVLVDGVKFGAAAAGVSFGFDLAANPNFGKLSESGVRGAFVAFENGDIGSPATVPEPSSVLLFGAALGLLALWCRRAS